MTEQVTQPRVVRNDERNRYEVWSGERLAGFSEYREQGERTVYLHTEVDDAFAGQGLGKVLAAGALDDAVARGRIIVPVCPFIASYVRKNPDRYEEHVHWRGNGKADE
ncbi:GNAT family N-acetyltransferase [Prauserella flavalba]|uniref:Acetyltransferase n=1 Tax=Prauserella flavalba TaxID=1477506 RepID=A0A318LLW4_9PSEU|nr:GNAT family N-acetyltransferase [Prauserella flavalba]PXY35463.1 acetyltransferase [Prauserella flavalba]